MDLQGTITYMSRSIEEMGFTEEEIEGANISQLLTPESYELAMNRLQKRLKGENINAPFEVGILNKSGIVVPFELNTSIITEEGELTGIEIVARNITERKQAEARTEKLLSQQRAVYRFSLALGALLDLHGICRLLADEIERLQGTNTLILSRFDRSTNLITPLYVMMDGTEMDVAELPTLPLAPEGEGMQSQVLRTGEPLYIPDWGAQEANLHTKYAVTDEKIVTSQIPDKSDRTSWTQSAVFLPLMIAGTPIGVMQVQSHRLDDFDDDDIVLLTGMASVAATGIERAELHTNVRAAFDGVVHALGVSTEMRDPYTAGHQRRVTELACAIAVELGLSSERQETLRVAGLLHDIGKMSVPAEILSRPGKLSSMEMDLLKSHARAGYEIVKGTSLPKDIADVILYHHERMDGSGYPEGLSGEAIPLESRILAVADVVEAMSSHRPYRAAHTLEEALREIETGAGTLYDSEVADACVRLFREERFHFSDKPG
jgi:PAS domain S-box-containing protein/putative nucleotidyltransferase with HDIG domain